MCRTSHLGVEEFSSVTLENKITKKLLKLD